MSTHKKSKDPAEAAFSAIEEALGISSGPADAAPVTEDKAADGTPRLPRVEDLDIFKPVEPETAAPAAAAPAMKPGDKAADRKAPEGKAEAKTPETKTPETKTPETKTPETKAPETKAPEAAAAKKAAPADTAVETKPAAPDLVAEREAAAKPASDNAVLAGVKARRQANQQTPPPPAWP